MSTHETTPYQNPPLALAYEEPIREERKPDPIPCGRCGRMLKHPDSIALGFGPVCARKIADTQGGYRS